jgi:hypothetical protein
VRLAALAVLLIGLSCSGGVTDRDSGDEQEHGRDSINELPERNSDMWLVRAEVINEGIRTRQDLGGTRGNEFESGESEIVLNDVGTDQNALLECNEDIWPHKCDEGEKVLGCQCSQSKECREGVCWGMNGWEERWCLDLCTKDAECQEGHMCFYPTICGSDTCEQNVSCCGICMQQDVLDCMLIIIDGKYN